MQSIELQDLQPQDTAPPASVQIDNGLEENSDDNKTLVPPDSFFVRCRRLVGAIFPSRHQPSYLERFPDEHRAAIWNSTLEDIPPRLIPIYEHVIKSGAHQKLFSMLYSPLSKHEVEYHDFLCRPRVLQNYDLAFGLDGLTETEFQSRILVNWDKDIVYFPRYSVLELLQEGFRITRQPPLRVVVQGVENVKTIALRVSEWQGRAPSLDMNKWTSLEKIMLVEADYDVGKFPTMTQLRNSQGHGFDTLSRKTQWGTHDR
ncbi:hypothetical protein ONS95_002295 [Cadophora gregata]|uniref:uncharacterized protein n=1 Tax=Cadophora gregata TaxID=51156 RepID=UPI0026DBF3EE|nr:uncharacterized protein ONS95_002295 [Cadophora gregata]KAK0109613.1 hypothetical protein ONS95_002295 [Cadophora gregata]KAK0110757.1 hypothetical protein ONS96_002355 [Cadophora gregata f. sp. sojae]